MNKKEKIKTLLETCSVDACLITDDYNRRYLSGYTGAEGIFIATQKVQYILTDFRYIEQAQDECEQNGIKVMDIDKKGYYQSIADIVEEQHIETIGFEDKCIGYHEYMEYKKILPTLVFFPLEDKVNRLRMIKTDEELAYVKKAEHIGDLAFAHILDYIEPGKTEAEIALELEIYMRQHGASGLSFDTIVASGVNSSKPHAMVSNKTIEYGDFITMDFGCLYEGYCSDMTRTIVVGKANSRQKEIYQCVLTAQERALQVIQPGVICWEADKVARDYIYEHGYEGCFGHGLGHSVGLYIHEEPRLSTKCVDNLEAGMTMTVEPGIYVPGFGGVRIEDLVVIKEDGYENYTHSIKSLIEL